MRALTLVLLLVTLIGAPTAEAAGWRSKVTKISRSVKAPFVLFGGWQKHNRKLDRDERLSLPQFARFQKSGVLPRHAAPARVLKLKIARANTALAQLRTAANGSRHRGLGLPGGLNESFDGTFGKLNQLSYQIQGARRYALDRGLGERRTRGMAREAIKLVKWHIDSKPSGGQGIGSFAVTFQGALQSYKDLSAIVNHK